VTNVLPWFVPGAVISLLAGLLTAPAIARGLRSGRGPAWLLVFGLGIVIAATLTPLGRGFEERASILRTCDFSRIGLAPLREYFRVDDTSLNVVLFIPLGVAVGLLPGSRRKWVIVGAAILLPVAIETLQLLAPALSRGCQSADVVDNMTGLVLGMVGATGARWLYAGRDTRG
jgi:glycopeptide antibiotics resistance protein